MEKTVMRKPLSSSSSSSLSPAALKEKQRAIAKEKRKAFVLGLTQLEKEGLAERLCTAFCTAFSPSPTMRVAAYWPLPYEADVSLLLHRLYDQGASLFLPRARPQSALTFHSWMPSCPLVSGPFHVKEPDEDAAESSLLSLTHILVPLLAFDQEGRRLGYGQGHYDRTFQALSKKGGPLLIGIAFACQEMSIKSIDRLVSETHDQALDIIITEKSVIHVRPGSARI